MAIGGVFPNAAFATARWERMMNDESSSNGNDNPESRLLGDLAESLQSAMNFVEAARRQVSDDGSVPATAPVLLENAMAQLTLVRGTYATLRTHLARQARQGSDR